MFTIIIKNNGELILTNNRFERTYYSNSPKQYTKIRFFVQLKIKAHVMSVTNCTIDDFHAESAEYAEG